MRILLLGSLVALVISAASARADEVKGKLKSVDADKHTLTVTFIDKDQTFQFSADVKVVHLVGKKAKKAQTEDLPGGVTALTTGSDVILTSEKKDGILVITAVKVEGLAKKKKK